MADSVEKLCSLRCMGGARKIDLSDRRINRAWPPAKGKRTPENLVQGAADEFFNRIGRTASVTTEYGLPTEPALGEADDCVESPESGCWTWVWRAQRIYGDVRRLFARSSVRRRSPL